MDGTADQLGTEELTRVRDAASSINQVVAPYGVTIYEIDASQSTEANLRIAAAWTTVVGGIDEGVLGVTEEGGLVTLVLGWNWYTGADAQVVAADQYDFQTIVTHEIGHALGLGHNEDAMSVMCAELATGVAHRALTTADLNVADDGSGPAALRVAAVRTIAAPAAAAPTSDQGSLTAAIAGHGFWEVPDLDRAGRSAWPGWERVMIAPAMLGRLSTTSLSMTTSVALQQVMPSAGTPLPKYLPRGNSRQADLGQLVDVLAAARVERTGDSRPASDAHTLDDVVDGGTELLEEELLELLARAAG